MFTSFLILILFVS